MLLCHHHNTNPSFSTIQQKIMKLVYTNTDNITVLNLRNILEAEGIEIFLKNEHASMLQYGFNTELWVIQDDDYEKALAIIDGIEKINHESRQN